MVFVGGPVDRDWTAFKKTAATGSYEKTEDGKTISRLLLNKGFDVVRVESRGVSNPDECTKDTNLTPLNYVARCINSSITGAVTSASQEADLAHLFAYLTSHSGLIRGGAPILLTGSISTLYAARLIERDSIQLSCLVSIGGFLESPSSHFDWQGIDRFVEEFRKMDEDGDGWITNSEVREGFDRERMGDFVAFGPWLFHPSGRWNGDLVEFRRWLELDQVRRRSALLADDPRKAITGSYPDGTVVSVASLETLVDRALDQFAVVERLRGFKGRTVLVIGEHDSQVSVGRQVKLFAAATGSGFIRGALKLVPGVGHSLGQARGPGTASRDGVDALLVAIDTGCYSP